MSDQPHAGEAWASTGDVAVRVRCYPAVGVADDAAPPSVVVLHGLVTGVDSLRAAVSGFDPFARLAAEGLNVAALDWPGHGRSGGRRGGLTYREAMNAAAAGIGVATGRWPGPVGLLGVGLGGALALYAGIENRRVAAVVAHGAMDLRDVTAAPTRARGRTAAVVAARARRRLPPRVQERLEVPARAILSPADLALHPVAARRLWRHPQAVRRYPLAALADVLLTPGDKPDLAAARAPTLLASGDADRVQTPVAVRQVQARLTCPQRTWALPGGGHQLLVDHPEAFVPVAGAFLREHLR